MADTKFVADERTKLERRIAKEIQAAIIEFEKATECGVSSVSVGVMEIGEVGKVKRAHIVSGVICSIEI